MRDTTKTDNQPLHSLVLHEIGGCTRRTSPYINIEKSKLQVIPAVPVKNGPERWIFLYVHIVCHYVIHRIHTSLAQKRLVKTSQSLGAFGSYLHLNFFSIQGTQDHRSQTSEGGRARRMQFPAIYLTFGDGGHHLMISSMSSSSQY